MSQQAALTLPASTSRPDYQTGSILFIGNATVLIRYAGFTILTDPNFIHRHEEVPIGYGMTAKRLTDPAMEIGDLPPLDLVVLSHFHGDHFDQIAERELDRSLPIVTTGHAAGELRERGFTAAMALDTWESTFVTKGEARLRITSLPGRHGPPVVDFALPDVMGSLLEFQAPAGEPLARIYLSGDTLAIDDLKEIPRRFPQIDVGLIHLGGTTVMGIMVTMDGKQGVEAIQMVDPKRVIPIHYDDYDLFKSPLSDFQIQVRAAGLEDRVHYLGRGETYRFSPANLPGDRSTAREGRA